jgi:hypothetical protein
MARTAEQIKADGEDRWLVTVHTCRVRQGCGEVTAPAADSLSYWPEATYSMM